MVRHGRFLAEGKLTTQDAGVSEHYSIMQMLMLAISFDQLQAAELACLELECRRGQMVEIKHRNRFIPPGGAQDDPYSDTHLYMGVISTCGMLAVCPALERYVPSELKEEFKGDEARRKAHEERALKKK